MSPRTDESLTGSRCSTCGVVAYPVAPTCPRCGDPAEETSLSRTGELWTWTVQHFPPKSPPYELHGEFSPFAVAYVELPDGVRIEAIVEADDLTRLHIGMPVELVAASTVPRFALTQEHV